MYIVQMELWVSANHARSTEIQLFHGYKMLCQYTCNVKNTIYVQSYATFLH